MTQNILLLVNHGSANYTQNSIFREAMISRGWKEGIIKGSFLRKADQAPHEIGLSVQEDVNRAACEADFGTADCEIFIVFDEMRFNWGWNSP